MFVVNSGHCENGLFWPTNCNPRNEKNTEHGGKQTGNKKTVTEMTRSEKEPTNGNNSEQK